jgi:opacity protein-like surface antigen
MVRCFTLVVCVLFAAPALAQEYSREGFSVGVSGSAAFENFDDTGGVDFDDTGALGAAASYRFHPNFAVDARFEHTFDFEGDAGPVDIDVNIWTLTANAQFFILTEQFQPYVIGGVGLAEAEVSVDTPFGDDDDTESDPVFRLGVGMDSYVSPNFVVGLEAAYNFGTNDLDDFDYWTLTALLRYRF